MKLIPNKLSTRKTSIIFIMSACFLALLFFIIVVYENKRMNNDNTLPALVSGMLGFFALSLLISRMFRDARLRKNSKDDQNANEIIYRSLIENAGVVMYTASSTGQITFASSKAFQLTGYSMKELIGMHFSELVDADWLETVTEKYRMQLTNNIVETLLEFCIRTKYGDLKWVEQSAVLITENNLPVGFQCIVKDISERKEMEEVLRKYEVELVQNQQRLRAHLLCKPKE